MTTHSQEIINLINAGKSRDEIIIHLVTTHGLSLNAAIKAFAEVSQSSTGGKVNVKAEALAYLSATFNKANWNLAAVQEAVAYCQAEWGCAESTARDYTKYHSEILGVVHPSANPRELMFKWLVENRSEMSYDAMKTAFKAYAGDVLGRSSSNINEYWKGYDLHLAILKADADALKAAQEAEAEAQAKQAERDAKAKEAQEEKEAASKDGTDPVTKAWKALDRAEAAFHNGTSKLKSLRNRCHPDKVASLNDAELTKAYSDFTKKVNAAYDKEKQAA